MYPPRRRRLRVLLVAVLVCGVWAVAGLVPRYRESSRRLRCLQNLARISAAMQKYCGNLSPDPDRWLTGLVKVGALTEDQCISPVSGGRYRFVEPMPGGMIAGDAVIYAPLAEGKGGGILYADGHASFHRPEEYRAIIVRSERIARENGQAQTDP